MYRPIPKVKNFASWAEIDAEQEDTNYDDPDNGKGICHDGLSGLANDMSEVSGNDFWWQASNTGVIGIVSTHFKRMCLKLHISFEVFYCLIPRLPQRLVRSG